VSLPKPPKEVPRDVDLGKLAPGVRRKVDALFAKMRARGHNPMVGEVFRTDARQGFLFGFGRKYDDGRGRVTKAPTADDTQHAYGLAVDVWDADNPKAPWLPKNPTRFRLDLHAICREVGLRWGADWDHDGSTDDETFKDWPHVQELAAPRSPSARDRTDRKAGNLKAVWARYGVDK
jgi:D-alanyl-D-alanine carboxypeptidase